MKISPREFEIRLNENQLRLALVGMSNSGKSTCTNLLAGQAEFDYFEVDEAINSALQIQTMEQAAQWMGYPFETDYAANKKKYLDLEERLTRVDISSNANFVLDTTGSIIYGSAELKRWIQENFLVVGLRVSEALCQTLIDDYFHRPKTVIWGSEFQLQEGEDGIDALKRCYPRLLENRSVLYSELADIEITAELARDPALSASQLLDSIKSQL